MSFQDDYKQLQSGAFGDPTDPSSGAYNALQKLMAANPGQATSTATAPYADIFQYMGNTPDNVRTGADLEGGGGTQNRAAGLTGTNPLMQSLIDNGTIGQTQQTYSNESGSGTLAQNNVDFTKGTLPTMGPAGVTLPSGQHWISAEGANLINPSMVYDDPNYGKITTSVNDKINQTNGYDMIGPIFAALLTAGAGWAAAPAIAGAELGAGAGAAGAGWGAGVGGTALSGAAGSALGTAGQALMQLPNAARSLGSGGGYGGILGLLGGLAGGATGIPLGSTLGKLAGSYAGSALTPKSATASPSSSLSTPQKLQLLMALSQSSLPRK